jgi:hypothetical protein
MKMILCVVLLSAAAPVLAQSSPKCPDAYKPCGNVCCPK